MSAPVRLLIVEDDEPTRSAVAAALRAHGFAVTEAGDVAAARRAWDHARADVIILDLGLPDRDGLSFLRTVRREATTPVLVLSAREQEQDKVLALDQGADDYVTKPVGLPELRARLNALLRRASGPAADTSGVLELGAIRLDPIRRSVTVSSVPVDLTPREYELLRALLAQPGRVLTHGRLLRAVWGEAYAEEAHYLHVYVSRLRRKLHEADPNGGARDLIQAEPGVGYRVADG